MDDIAEQQQLADEISTAISNPVGFDQNVDEDDLIKELEDLQMEDVENELLNLPTTPSHKLPQAATTTNKYISKNYINN